MSEILIHTFIITTPENYIIALFISQELLVRLTDEQDPFVLLSCVVREEDYHTLRLRQGLLVDFSAFPHKFVELVSSCIQESSKESPRWV